MGRHKTFKAFLTLQNKASFPWESGSKAGECFMVDKRVLAWEKLRITATEEENRSFTIISLKCFTPPNSLY